MYVEKSQYTHITTPKCSSVRNNEGLKSFIKIMRAYFRGIFRTPHAEGVEFH